MHIKSVGCCRYIAALFQKNLQCVNHVTPIFIVILRNCSKCLRQKIAKHLIIGQIKKYPVYSYLIIISEISRPTICLYNFVRFSRFCNTLFNRICSNKYFSYSHAYRDIFSAVSEIFLNFLSLLTHQLMNLITGFKLDNRRHSIFLFQVKKLVLPDKRHSDCPQKLFRYIVIF